MNLSRHLDHLFNPRSVAVIGASNTPGKWGFGFLSLLLSKGGREVYAVNRNGGEVLGARAYRSLREVPGPVDMAVIVTAYHDVPAAMEDCVFKGVKFALVISGGFSEASEEGARVEREVVEIATRGGIRFIGPNCMGYFDAYSELFAIPFKTPIRKGPVSLISQSGNSGLAAVALGWDRGLGFSKYINSGNEADIHFEDYLEYLGRDERTDVILGNIEGLREGKRFLDIAREITRRKPLVVLKSGRTEDGARAARSHSAALAGSDPVSDAAFKQCGAIRVEKITDLVDMAQAFIGQPLPRGRRVAVLSMGGGLGVISTDALSRLGMEIARLSSKTLDRLDSVLPGRWSRANPVDPGGDPIIYPCIWPLLEDENVDALMVVGGIGMVGGLAGMMPIPDSAKDRYDRLMEAAEQRELADLERLLEMSRRYQKPVVAASMVSGSVLKSRVSEELERNYLTPYPGPERAARALACLVEYSEYVGIARG